LQIMEGFLQSDSPHLVVTVGPEMVMRAQENEEFRALVNGADLVVPDGAGILWAGRQCGVKFPERVAGVELIVNLAKRLGQLRSPLFLLGAAPGIAERAGQKLREQIEDLPLVGVNDGYFKEPQPIVDKIRASEAKVLYVGMGSPAQERWVRQYGDAAGIRLGIGVGGSFDVISGLKKRAPQWMIKLHLEWLYRLACEPTRVGRMAAIPKFMMLVKKKGADAVKPWEGEDS
ncbi:WecB/TagA/CpsF family glycosyltransferase, partial [bacterium]|nr:WecB/TagA/CpsF family glycosyltransferase [bacterium]